MTELPEVRATTCGDCPWRRTSTAGWLGPQTAREWIATAQSEDGVACHLTLDGSGWDNPDARQCRGAAIYRGNVAKLPRDPEIAVCAPDRETIFATPAEFLAHHDPSVLNREERRAAARGRDAAVSDLNRLRFEGRK